VFFARLARNLERCKLTKIFENGNFSENDGEAFKMLVWKQICHRIPHKWEGRPTVFQTDYMGSLPTIFFSRIIIGYDGEEDYSREMGSRVEVILFSASREGEGIH